MIIVTGGAGFIGSQIVRALNQRGRRDILVVEDMRDGRKVRNLAGLDIEDLIDREDFLHRLDAAPSWLAEVDAVLHQGACSTTTEWDGREMLRVNYEYSKSLLSCCLARAIPMIYASSASVYGGGRTFIEERKHEHPLNPYAYSKFLFDEHVRRLLPEPPSQIVGLRYFNVYGPGEFHKDDQASVAFKLYQRLRAGDEALELFAGSHGCADGEHRRDFVFVGDCVAVVLWFLDSPGTSGIYNVGSGRAQSFNDVARAVCKHFGRGEIRYVPMPDHLRGSYQAFTEANLDALRGAGYATAFASVEDGVARYMQWLDAERSADFQP